MADEKRSNKKMITFDEEAQEGSKPPDLGPHIYFYVYSPKSKNPKKMYTQLHTTMEHVRLLSNTCTMIPHGEDDYNLLQAQRDKSLYIIKSGITRRELNDGIVKPADIKKDVLDRIEKNWYVKNGVLVDPKGRKPVAKKESVTKEDSVEGADLKPTEPSKPAPKSKRSKKGKK